MRGGIISGGGVIRDEGTVGQGRHGDFSGRGLWKIGAYLRGGMTIAVSTEYKPRQRQNHMRKTYCDCYCKPYICTMMVEMVGKEFVKF